MSEKPPGAGEPEETVESQVWQINPPGSFYDYIRVASFSLGPDGRIAHWSERAEELLGLTAAQAIGRDPVEAFVPRALRDTGRRAVADILDGREWTGLVPYRSTADGGGARGLAEVYVMPAQSELGERTALCVAVDVGALRGLETDLAAAQAVFGQSPLGFFLFGTDLRMIRVNERFATVFGRPADAYRGMLPQDLLPRAEAARMSAALRQVLETGQPVTELTLVGTVPGNPERRRWSVSLYRLHGGSGRPIGVAGLATDVTGRRRAEQEAAGVRRNLALLNEAGARIGTSLDLETTARELLDVAVPQFCDLASVDLHQGLLSGDETPPGLPDGSAELRRVAFASAISDGPIPFGDCCRSVTADDGGIPGIPKPVQVGEMHRYPFNSPCAQALRTAQVRVVPGRDSAESPELGTVLQSTLVVPMIARDTVVGLAQFSRAKGSEPFGERDTALAVELAARAAVSIDNARLYRREHERALILQRSLLPPGDPEAAGLDIACRYLPGNAATEVGGDWFDVIELPGHRTALVVGDVMGRGLRAAVAMGELRTAVRTLALLDLEPAEVLAQLDEICRGLGTPGPPHRTATRPARGGRSADGSSDLAEVYLATCVYAVYDPVTRRCTIANAGHLPTVLVEPGDPARLMEMPAGLPLGVGGEPFEETEVELRDGALLALYTDGLVESRDHALDEGLQALRTALTGRGGADSATASLEDVCDHVLSSLDTHHGEDDIALLMARVQGLPADSVGDWQLLSDPQSVGRARELTRTQLESWDLAALADTTELLVSELVTNALRYGEGEIRLRLLLDRTLVCEVWDGGLVQPRRRRARDTDEGGRGLQLVGLLSAGWGSRRTPRGKTVWFELHLPDGTAQGPDSVEAVLSLW
ncbi:SpoIIE family protein phosphatase [Streptomyces sp. B1866]|uniref:SpoIIE family protein phosphatase n=1 Tax=Streptomyces sp. B1866 TaxID=3075431 RepID=UPI00288E4185|nr:SpoIIE family protein phosphatase [Streptomyces sp. B1866]MDT3397393.1 SpoIIE family protein phosphatase [Streptomyces sp. B1866]